MISYILVERACEKKQRTAFCLVYKKRRVYQEAAYIIWHQWKKRRQIPDHAALYARLQVVISISTQKAQAEPADRTVREREGALSSWNRQ